MPSPEKLFRPMARAGVVPWVRGALLALILADACAAEPGGEITGKPLAPLSGPRGKTMFVAMPSSETGVQNENRYADPRMWGERYLEAGVGSIGSGVAIGDYDGDGRPDIFVVAKSDSCRLFRNLGNWKFEDTTDRAGVGDAGDAALVWKQGATFVDINNDGRLDIYVCRFDAPNLLYINQGDGTFKEMAHSYGLDVRDASGVAAFCDYDRDGWLDVFIQTNLLSIARHPNGQRNYLFHNNRDGTFTNVTEQAGINGEAQGHSATWWDLDGSGWPDLYVANDFGVPDRLYHNNRDGTFTDILGQVVPHTTFASMGSDFGDINNDGRFDFMVADMAATTHQKDQRTTSGIRAGTFGSSDEGQKVPKYLHNALYLNTGTGRCLEAAFLAGIAATDWTWSVRFEDLDNDGRLDLFLTNGMNREQSNLDLISREMSAETAEERVRIMHDSPVMAERNLAFRNMGDLEFKNVSADWGLDQNGVSFGSAVGDLDGDGDLDIACVNYQRSVSLFRNDSDTGHRLVLDLRGTVSNHFGVGATVRIDSASGPQVRQLVLARGYMSSSEPMVHFGLGEDRLVRKLTVSWPSGFVQSFESLAVDQRYTITEPSGRPPPLNAPVRPAARQFTESSDISGPALRSREEPIDETAQQRLLPLRLNGQGPGLAVGDVDGDGIDDVCIGGTTTDPARVLLGGASGRFAAGPALAAGAAVDDGPVLLFDSRGTGANDLLVTGGGNRLPAGAPEYQPRLYLNDGHGGFRPAPENSLPPLPISVGAVAAADFARDGRLGLFIGARLLPGEYPLPPQSALLVNRGGKFEEVTDAVAPALREIGMVTAALWTDVDGDGWPDLLIALDWGQVCYFHNDRGRSLEDWTARAGFAAAGTGRWTSIAAADFNGDGKMDYVVGNLGLNTQYRADAAHPALLYSGDFKGDGSNQLIEAYYEGDRLYPWRSRKDLGAVIPSILRRFPKNDPFARATVEEIFGADKLNRARRFAATELRSGVFLSQPDGTYRFEPLPRIAQIAPLQGIVAGDFDGDGHADIYAVQNSYAPIPSVGRFDGGLSQLLLGDGRGNFTPVPPGQSGLLVPGDAKALAVLSLGREGWPGFLVTRNDDSGLAFRNDGVPGHHSLQIKLRGPVGNPTAVGARVMVELSDGSVVAREIYAGSGYYSQSTASAFVGYPDANPPRKIRVRWPSGATTEHEPATKSALLILIAPPGGNGP
ncbi:MAG TPA: FG-GAP-like repeat-containing protein [Candidatus Didemnitutus sp.]|jgi:hypothetical protein